MSSKNFSKLIAASLAFSSAAFSSVNPASALILNVEITEDLKKKMVKHAVWTQIMEEFYDRTKENPNRSAKDILNEACNRANSYNVFLTLCDKPWGFGEEPPAIRVLGQQIENEDPELVKLIEEEKNHLYDSIK